MAAFSHIEAADMPLDIDPNASPIGSIDTNTTPDTEFSPPESPFQQFPPLKSPRLLARSKLSALTQEEKVYDAFSDGPPRTMVTDLVTDFLAHCC